MTVQILNNDMSLLSINNVVSISENTGKGKSEFQGRNEMDNESSVLNELTIPIV
jgi:hypothetical protein